MRCSVEQSGYGDECEEVTITFGGDCELETFLDALRFGVDTLETQTNRKSFEPRLSPTETAMMLEALEKAIVGSEDKEEKQMFVHLKRKLEAKYKK